MPDPVTRSFSVLETRIWPGPARAAMHTPMWTPMPNISATELDFSSMDTGADLDVEHGNSRG